MAGSRFGGRGPGLAGGRQAGAGIPVVFLVVQRWSPVTFPRMGRRPWREASALSAGVLAGVFLFLLAIPASLIGWEKNLGYIGTWHSGVVANQRVGQTANFNIRSSRNQSLANGVYLAMKFRSAGSRPRGAWLGSRVLTGWCTQPCES